jgi:hypothetical protein
MDDSLLNTYIDQVILPLYPNISKYSSFDADTGKPFSVYYAAFHNATPLTPLFFKTRKLLAGPVVLKLDSGPRHIVALHGDRSERRISTWDSSFCRAYQMQPACSKRCMPFMGRSILLRTLAAR